MASLPIIIVSGNHYQIGLDIGSKFKNEITNFIKNYDPLHSIFIPFYNTENGKKVYDDYLSVSVKRFPEYVDEIEGYSDGSGVPFSHLFLVLLRVEITILTKKYEKLCTECSDLFVFHDSEMLLGHNEDMHPAIKGCGYIVDAEIQPDPTKYVSAVGAEKFTAYSYPGHLPGNCMGFNRIADPKGCGGKCIPTSPMVITMDGLSATYVGTNGRTPRGILCRAVLGKAYDMSSLKTILYDEGYGAAVGFSVNVATTNPERFYNVEVSPVSDDVERPGSRLDVKEILASDRFYYHFNKYERIKVDEVRDYIKSSIHREKTAQKILKERPYLLSMEDVKYILGDTSDTEYPIYRTNEPSSVTLATGIFDMKQKRWILYTGNPRNDLIVATYEIC